MPSTCHPLCKQIKQMTNYGQTQFHMQCMGGMMMPQQMIAPYCVPFGIPYNQLNMQIAKATRGQKGKKVQITVSVGPNKQVTVHPREGEEGNVEGEDCEESEECGLEICKGNGSGGSDPRIGEGVKDAVDQAMKLLNDQVSQSVTEMQSAMREMTDCVRSSKNEMATCINQAKAEISRTVKGAQNQISGTVDDVTGVK